MDTANSITMVTGTILISMGLFIKMQMGDLKNSGKGIANFFLIPEIVFTVVCLLRSF